MNEDVFNSEIRKFLKQVGVTSQREIEKAVREAIETGKLKSDTLSATMTLRVGELDLTHEIKSTITLG
jgi:phage tail tube protein FII